MSFWSGLLDNTSLSAVTVLIRILMGFVVGGLIGLEREHHKQPAGLRTHILISTGATLLMVLSLYVPRTFLSAGQGDPGRIASQVVSGIGFLGAGTILRLGVNVKGLTTAASIWTTAGIGLAIGAGLYFGALVATICVLLALTVLNLLERRFFPGKYTRAIAVYMTGSRVDAESIEAVLEAFDLQVRTIGVTQLYRKNRLKLRFMVQVPEKLAISGLYHRLGELEGVYRVSMGQQV